MQFLGHRNSQPGPPLSSSTPHWRIVKHTESPTSSCPSWLRLYICKDRGSVRAANNKTFDSHANHFENWLLRNGTDLRTLARIPPEVVIAVIGMCMRCVNLGVSCRGKSNMAEKTLGGYMRLAATAWAKYAGYKVPLYDMSGGKSKPVLNKYIADIFEQRRAWKEPKQEREPFISAMFIALGTHLTNLTSSNGTAFLSLTYAVFDWCRLGAHTGSRLGECGQSKPKKGKPFATIPFSTEASRWAGMPIAFILKDFILYDDDLACRQHAECLKTPSLTTYVWI